MSKNDQNSYFLTKCPNTIMLDYEFIQILFSHHLLLQVSWKKFQIVDMSDRLNFKKSFVQFVFNIFFDSFRFMQAKSFMARTALSSVIHQQQNVSFGNTPIIKRYMKGIFENNPTLPKNVSLIFSFCNMQEIRALDIQKLAQKLVTPLRRSEDPDLP